MTWNDYDIGAYDRQHMDTLREEANRERLAKECRTDNKGLIQTVREAAERLIQR
jgi:hypothetical protein